MWFRKKKIINPKLNAFVKDLKDSGFLLINDGGFGRSDVWIEDPEEFRRFAKRNDVYTIFRMAGLDYIYYFMLVDGAVIHTRILKKIRE